MLNKIRQPMVVGYKGEIGSFILSGLLKTMPKALDIWCVDIKETEDEVKERLNKSDVIFLCVPLQSTMSWLHKYQLLLKNKLIVEQCSLKEWLYKNDIVSNVNVASMHVLFRPSQTPDLKDRRVALFEDQSDKLASEDVKEITQSEIIWYRDAEEHDREMAIQQALLHRTLLILGKLLKQNNGSTYISKKVLELVDRVRKGNLDLYKLIQDNKYLPDVLKELKKEFEQFDIEKFW